MDWRARPVRLRRAWPAGGGGDRRPLPSSGYSPDDLSRVSDYRITATGRTEADRVRRQRREALTDASIGGVLPNLVQSWMSEPQRRAISVPLRHLRSARDGEQYAAAVGAAKDLAEAACKVGIERAGSCSQRSITPSSVQASGRRAGRHDHRWRPRAEPRDHGAAARGAAEHCRRGTRPRRAARRRRARRTARCLCRVRKRAVRA
jgi:hypothetical protein